LAERGIEIPDTDTAARAEGPDILELATRLVGTTRLDDVLALSLQALARAVPTASWALLVRIGPKRYRAALRGTVGHGDLRRVVEETCGPRAWLSVDQVVPNGAIAGQGTWWAASFDAERSDGNPDLLVLLWSRSDRDSPIPWGSMARTAKIIAAAAGSAVSFERLLEQSSRDSLTGVLNRRGILSLLDREQSRAKRGKHPLSVVFLDIDRFKNINDRFGHSVGDDVLIAVSRHLRDGIRASDAIGRLGGDEYLIVLPDTAPHVASRIGRRLADRIQGTELPTAVGPLRVQVTFGAAGSSTGTAPLRLIERADRRMLSRKRGRRSEPGLPVIPVHSPDAARAVSR